MTRKLILCLALVLSGGLFTGCDTDKMASQKGTWVGMAKLLIVYNASGVPHKVLELTIEQGTKMSDAGYDEGSFDTSKAMKQAEKDRFFSPTVIIVDKKYFAVDPKIYEGMRLKVQGTIEIASAIDPNDKSRLIWITPKYDPNPKESIPAIIRTRQIEIIGSTKMRSSHWP